MNNDNNIRLDKWLWAARFFKTRSIASDMISGGKVHYNGNRVKPAKIIEIGALIQIKKNDYTKSFIIKKLESSRKSAMLASQLYEETQESIEAFEEYKNNKKYYQETTKPSNKKERRQLSKFKLNYI